ncbi:MAG TPA: trypsin-like peptidase domain-containing protein [Patescibacteria group bacterium]
MQTNFERQKLVALALACGLLAGVLGGSATLLSLSVLNIPGLSNPNGGITSTTTKKERVVLEESSAVIDAAKKVSPSVVSITTSRNIQDFFSGRTVQEKGGGTGFILTSDGLIVTNKHVVSEGDTEYTVLTSDGKSYTAKVLSTDPFNDLAVLKVDAKGLKPVELGDSNALQVGQWVIAIGNALGEFQNTVTVGVVSAKDRRITASDEVLDSLLQTDAAINPGNSGGPLVNLAGQVVGINTAIAGGAEGIGFAINIDSVKTALDSVQKTGKIVRPWLGVRYLSLNKEIARSAQLPVDHGALVYRGTNPADLPVVPGSPADKAGLAENDIITQINGQEINENNSLVSLLQKYKVGEKVTLTVLRKGEEKKIDVLLEEQK